MKKRPAIYDDIKTKFIDVIERQAYQNHIQASEYFRDWVTMATLTTSGMIMGMIGAEEVAQKRIEGSQAILEKYPKEDIEVFLELTNTLVKEMAKEPRDILGTIYQRINASNDSMGQFFTPLHICTLMSEFTTDTDITLPYNSSDPTCGSGAMAIGEYIVMKNRGYTTKDFNFLGQDIDPFCCMMAFMQLEALGMSAVHSLL